LHTANKIKRGQNSVFTTANTERIYHGQHNFTIPGTPTFGNSGLFFWSWREQPNSELSPRGINVNINVVICLCFGILLIVFSIGFLHDRLALEDFRHAISGASPSEMENGAATFSSLLSHIIGGCVAAGFLCGISGKLKRIVDGCDP
jgi:hypothetical protein